MLKVKNLRECASGKTVTALGFFDGVHKGHERLISDARKKADELSLSLSVFTFSSLPGKYYPNVRIFTTEERDEILASLGVDRVYTVDFDGVRNMSAEDFVGSVLIDKINTEVAFCGENFRFGKGASYDFPSLKREMEKRGRNALSVKEVIFDGEKISSSDIKDLISNGNVALANTLLSCDFYIENTVVRGRGVGKTLGFPTVNLEIQGEKIKPKRGVYKSRIECEKRIYPAITNIGICPTFSEREVHAECFILNGHVDLYGRTVRVYLEKFIRGEERFDSPELLASQIKKDIESVKGK